MQILIKENDGIYAFHSLKQAYKFIHDNDYKIYTEYMGGKNTIIIEVE